MQKSNRSKLLKLMVIAVAVGLPVLARAGTDATTIVDDASAAFSAVATLCVAIGTFFVVYRLAKRIR